MKKLLALLIIFGCVFVVGGSAYSLPTSGQDVILSRTSDTYGGALGGGEFLINVYDDNGVVLLGQYTSFCVEYHEHISLNNRFNIANVADYAEGVYGEDSLSDETKWLFWNYLYGSDTRLMRDDSDRANAVQLAIWDYEDEIGNDSPYYTGSLTTEAEAIKRLVDDTFSIGNINDLMAGVGTVKVLNLTYSGGGYAQSQIIAEPVPEPATMLLFGTGLVGLAGVARRKKKN